MCFGGNSSPAPAPAQVVKPTYVHNPYLDSFGDPASGAKDNPNVTNRSSLEIPIGFTGRGGKGESSGTTAPDGTGLAITKKAQSSGLAIRPAPTTPSVALPIYPGMTPPTYPGGTPFPNSPYIHP